MALKLVKAKAALIRTDDSGKRVTVQPGGFFYARNMEIRQLLAARLIEEPCDLIETHGLGDCGVVALRGDVTVIQDALNRTHLRSLPVIAGDYATREFARTLYWDTRAALRADLIAVGFLRLVGGWQMTAPLCRYEQLAATIGSDADRAATAAIIHDLRVPTYEVRALFARDCAPCNAVLDALATADGDLRLAFLRAVYQEKPVLCAVPTTWVR